ncbi:FAD-binding protein [Trichocoleus sp. FACHB-46]|nr:FAD-binding protein [Trichocoleus sp. FACHB-46]
MNNIVKDLQYLVSGEVSSRPEMLAEFSQDFGNVFHKKPQVVVRPHSVDDVVKTVRYAHQQGLIISPRATGHSLSGQSLSQNGIVLDMRSLNQIHKIHKDALYFKADAGVSWGQVVNACTPDGLVPPVLTNYFNVTLGGTHAAAGVGASSFRNGTQASNCLGLEVVTAEGEIVWCSPEENSELFHHVLCGFGQFGIITQVQHKLRRYPPLTRTYLLFYDDLDALLHDKKALVLEKRVDHLVSLPIPCVQGVSRATGIMQPLIQWFYTLQITIEMSAEDAVDDREVLAGLNFYRHIHTENLDFEQFIAPTIQVETAANLAHPWTDVFLPASTAKNYIETALQKLPSFLDVSRTPMGCFCLVNRDNRTPMFALPDEELLIGFGVYPTIPRSQLQPVLAELSKLSDLSFEMGGKRYLTGLVNFETQQWQRQFGDYWPTIHEMKKKYDPQGVLNPGFFQKEWIAEPLISQEPQTIPQTISEDLTSEFPIQTQPLEEAASKPMVGAATSTKLSSLQAIALAMLALLFLLFFNESLVGSA